MTIKHLALGLTLSTSFVSAGFANDATCIPKKAHMDGQTIMLDESCMLSFPGYGNGHFGRSYIDQFGELFVFAQVAETGIDSKDFGSRTYFLLPVRQTSDFEVKGATGELVIKHSSGETMTLAPDFKVKSFTGVEYVEAETSTDANKGGFEIKRYNNGILLDTGWTHSAITIKPEGQSTFTDRTGNTCLVKNKEVFNFSGSYLENADFKYPGSEELQTYLKKRCPNLDLSVLQSP
jgi:hypothetical protein